MKDEEICRALTVGVATVERVRRRGVEEGIEASPGTMQRFLAESPWDDERS